MTKPLVIFADPVTVALRVLRGAFAATLDAGDTITHSLPKRDVDTLTSAVIVADDGDAGTSVKFVAENAILRVSVWDKDAHRAGRIAASARAHLLADPGAADSRGFTGGTRPFVTNDPDDGTPVSSFTIIARLRAE